MRTPLAQPLLAALAYLRALLASTDPKNWAKLKRGISSKPRWDLLIAPRWRRILEADWLAIGNTPSPLALDRATLHHSIPSELDRQRASQREQLDPRTNLRYTSHLLDVEKRISRERTFSEKAHDIGAPSGE